MLGNKDPSKMVSDRLSNASGKHSGGHTHLHCALGPQPSCCHHGSGGNLEIVNAFTDTSGRGQETAFSN